MEEMSGLRAEILTEDAALPQDARERIRSGGAVDMVIGIPSYRNARTIGEVLEVLSDGVSSYFPDQRVLLVNADASSSDGTPRLVENATFSPNVSKLLTTYEGQVGKGSAIRAILEAAVLSRAKACLVVEARCPGITAEWLPALINPVFAGMDVALAIYQSSPMAAALTDNLAYPFVRMLFSADLRDPLSSEFCVSCDMALDLISRDVWDTDVARFGFNPWLTVESLISNRPLVQVHVGYRGEGHLEPGVLNEVRFLHSVGTLLRNLTTYRTLWSRDLPKRRVPYEGTVNPDAVVDGTASFDLLLHGFEEGQAAFAGQWRQIMRPQTLAQLLSLLDQPQDNFTFPPDLWADIVTEFGVVYSMGDGDPDKVVEALLPIFYGRAADYVRSAEGKTISERERIVQDLAETFVTRLPLLRRLWNDYEPRIDPEAFWPSV